MTLSTPPDWPHCGRGADPDTDDVGCRGIHVPGHAACLAHLEPTDRAGYFAGLRAGADVDHRGTTFDRAVLHGLLAALRDPGTDAARLGDARFDEATFTGDAWFNRVTFTGRARFKGAIFARYARFGGANFAQDARFNGATFAQEAWFGRADFAADAWFDDATFTQDARFNGTAFAGSARFSRATFTEDARFNAATFTGDARFKGAAFAKTAVFDGATFTMEADFFRATFADDARFDGVTFFGDALFGADFAGDARFSEAVFTADARFRWAKFTGLAWFDRVTFATDVDFERVAFADAVFEGTRFTGTAEFDSAIFTGNASFHRATFQDAQSLGPLACQGTLSLSRAVFAGPVTVEAAAAHVRCVRTQWGSTATLRLRHAVLDLTDAVLTLPIAVTAHPAPFDFSAPLVVDGSGLTWSRSGLSVTSLRGVDCAMLSLSDVDLTLCRFAGAFHLDQLRLEGRYTLCRPPAGVRWRGRLPVRWTPRRILAEEQHWRASRGIAADGWSPAPEGVDVLEPVALAPVYRQLRKAFEDGKHEPGAADFYYGEMEMRRHADDIPRSERALLTAYWTLSGYGLRAARAIGWLTVAMATTVVLMMGFGLPDESPRQEIAREKVDGEWTTVLDKPDPKNPTGARFTTHRFEQALDATLNSVVFRSSGQDLTTAGGYIEMASRFTEPVLLGFAALAVRGRVKRGS
ncbi:pentapeptide repeat-containing protein [Streptomyces sp. MZ04]|uniref:pentapeptide repeat-containing protein n=1 Tax=Streptomyces sp. MZ04 TaxID=2559236 RepID=UPI00107E700F|nr:pentapeptide repeat-containing protein [Streptomyces sp. MZ04]TGB12114.1 pentapeptide repeat-containing protein [Streptomyces sp. MZ04]